MLSNVIFLGVALQDIFDHTQFFKDLPPPAKNTTSRHCPSIKTQCQDRTITEVISSADLIPQLELTQKLSYIYLVIIYEQSHRNSTIFWFHRYMTSFP